MTQISGLHGEAPNSLASFKARMCECGDPICFGTLSSRDVEWLVRYTERLKRKAASVPKSAPRSKRRSV